MKSEAEVPRKRNICPERPSRSLKAVGAAIICEKVQVCEQVVEPAISRNICEDLRTLKFTEKVVQREDARTVSRKIPKF